MNKHFRVIFLILAIVLFFFYTMIDNVLFFVAGTFFALPGIISLISSNCGAIKTFAIGVFISSIVDALMTSYGIGGSLVFFVVCGITTSCLSNLKIFFTTSLFLCFWLIAFLYYQLFFNGMVNGDIFLQYGLSKNYPGSLLVIFNCQWAIWKYLHYHKLPLLLPVISTVIAFFLDGRSSLVCMVLISLFCFVFRGKKIIGILFLLLVFLISYYWNIIVRYYELTSLASHGIETTRTDIWKAYFDNLDLFSFIFGLDTQNIPIIKDYGGNPHNSFLSFHRRMGLMGLCLLFFYLYKGFKVLIKRKMFVVLFFSFILMLRMFFDGMLVTPEDFFILTLFFIPLYYNNDFFCIEEQIETHGDSWIEKVWDKVVYFL